MCIHMRIDEKQFGDSGYGAKAHSVLSQVYTHLTPQILPNYLQINTQIKIKSTLINPLYYCVITHYTLHTTLYTTTQVRGKDFRHEKTKKKRGSYRGGSISLDSFSFKYSD